MSFALLGAELQLLLDDSGRMLMLGVGDREQLAALVHAQPLAELSHVPEGAGARQVVVAEGLRIGIHGVQPLDGKETKADGAYQHGGERGDDLAADAEPVEQMRYVASPGG
jgi:hypothetical protein